MTVETGLTGEFNYYKELLAYKYLLKSGGGVT